MKDFERLGFDMSVQHEVCSVYGHSESHYSLQNTSFATVERGRKRPTPTRSVSHFCPSHRLFCSAVFVSSKMSSQNPSKNRF